MQPTPQTPQPLPDLHAGMGLYIHVPFCSTRCGYCDFNTYTPQELAGETTSAAARGNTIEGYLDALARELEIAASVWERHGQPINTVFFGGGTPSMLGHAGLAQALRAVTANFTLAADAEVTTECNPDSTSPEFFTALRAAGFTRISLGMQSAAGHVLKVLERTHTPGRPEAAVAEAIAAGFEHINLDLIYGTPTERDEDLQRSLDAVLATGVDHVSAYSLIIEDGTAMARKVRKGQLHAPDEDVLADRYTMIDTLLAEAGYRNYEVSNWARPGGECRHNLLYWQAGQWWGAGPGAHGSVELRSDLAVGQGIDRDLLAEGTTYGEGTTRTRLVNAKRPATYFAGLMLESGEPAKEGATGTAAPRQNRHIALPGSVSLVEPLTQTELDEERIFLGLRLVDGIPVAWLGQSSAVQEVLKKYETLGLIAHNASRVWMTEQGKYLADGIVGDIMMAMDE